VGESPFPLAFTWVPGREPGIVFLHGLGSSGRCFRDGFDSPRLGGRAMLVPDLVGFGASPAPEGFPYTMAAQAEAVAALCRRMGLGRLAIVGHSMGGAVGILLAERWPGPATHFTSAAGNLVAADCFLSRRVVEMGQQVFEDAGFEELKRGLRPRGGERRSLRAYFETLERTSTQAMFESSQDLVSLCDRGDLLGRFIRLDAAKQYLHDSDSEPPAELRRSLAAAGIPAIRIPDTGHGLMEDAPGAFYSALADFLEAAG
jgi:pimeloyl-ACP methyl ester carboxylesterase